MCLPVTAKKQAASSSCAISARCNNLPKLWMFLPNSSKLHEWKQCFLHVHQLLVAIIPTIGTSWFIETSFSQLHKIILCKNVSQWKNDRWCAVNNSAISHNFGTKASCGEPSRWTNWVVWNGEFNSIEVQCRK